ncbi:MAG: threonylcarbamoyl-AMP synthase [Planctomycetota bacterium]|nr:MAG: threonylcarbamoyl-AMP synthase [Planctomycetota bacterium]
MQTKVIKIDAERIDASKIKDSASLIDSGGLVAFPTETVYGIACRVESASLTKLDKLKGRNPDKRYTLHLGWKTDLKKYLPTVGLRAEKLIRNGWPGPLTIVFELDAADIKKQQNHLDKETFKILYKDNSIGIRCPANSIAALLLRETRWPVVAPSANTAGRKPAINAEQVLAQLSGQIELLLDAGPCQYKKSSTVVKIGKKGLEILRPGVYSQAELEAMSQVKFLFVCTGNTCRSPMAEGMFRRYLAEKLKCNVDYLDKMGYKVCSAGTMGITGLPASAEAVAACAAKGIDIKAHSSTALTQQLVEECDYIFAMSKMHCERIDALSSGAVNRCVLLEEGRDIPDPIGQPQRVYNNCAERIEKAVKKRVSELVI